MFTRHFFKMFLGLIGMILLGILGLFLINAYQKSQGTTIDPTTGIANPIAPY